jgi:hypothetical protein
MLSSRLRCDHWPVPEPFATDPAVVAEQAGMVASAWSAPGAPASWALTAAQFAVLRDDPELLAIAATIPPDRVPPLLFSAAATFLVTELAPEPLRDSFPRVGAPQPPVADAFADRYRAFCLEHSDRLLELCARHRYQMNEVGRCADVVPALAPVIEEGRAIALVDIGTGAGLALHLDRYRYAFRRDDGRQFTVGEPGAPVLIETELRGASAPPILTTLPHIRARIGIDIEPLDLTAPGVKAWLAACIPQEIGAVTRFHDAVALAIERPARTVRGDACTILPEVLSQIPEHLTVCIIDSYVHVFFGAEELERFRGLVDRAGAQRDLDWISIDPLVPMGSDATHSVLGIPVPSELIERNRRDGVFGVIARLSYRGGTPSAALLGIAHPGAAWLEWLAPSGSY